MISTGFEFSLGIKSDNSLYSWGFNGNNQLGNGTKKQKIEPVQIGHSKSWTSISAGASFGFAISSDSLLYAWGFNQYGQLGLGSIIQIDTITQVGIDHNWKDISGATGFYANSSVFGLHVIGLKTPSNTICTSGANYVGQLGNGSNEQSVLFDCNTGDITSIIESGKLSNLDIKVYPNPSNRIFSIEIPQKINCKRVYVYNAYGELIKKSDEINNFFNLDLINNNIGIYLLIIETDKGIIRKRLIIN